MCVCRGGREGKDVLCRTLKFWRYWYSVFALNLTLVMGTSTVKGALVSARSAVVKGYLRKMLSKIWQ